MSTGTRGPELLILLELEVQVLGSHLMWVLRTELKSSGRAVKYLRPLSHLSSLQLPLVCSPGPSVQARHYPQTSPEATVFQFKFPFPKCVRLATKSSRAGSCMFLCHNEYFSSWMYMSLYIPKKQWDFVLKGCVIYLM